MELKEANLIVWRKEDFPGGTIGSLVFEPKLDGRKRLGSILDLPAKDYVIGVRPSSSLHEEGIDTVGGVLRRDASDFGRLLIKNSHYRAKTLENLSNLFKKILLGPDDYFMLALFANRFWERPERENVLIRPEIEPERGKVIAGLLNDLDQHYEQYHPESRPAMKAKIEELNPDWHSRVRAIMDLRLGMTDWHARSYSEIGQYFGVVGERIKQQEARGLRWLRHPSKAKFLVPYLPDGLNLG